MIKILVAEDEPKSRQALASRLRGILGENALIEQAANGSEAVSKTAQIQPDLVFMDIEMPLKNGVEAAAVIKRQRPETHIVFLTAYDRFDYAVGALRSGGEEYLLKPISEADLRETLQKFFHVAPEKAHEASPFEAELEVWVCQHYTEDAAHQRHRAGGGLPRFQLLHQGFQTSGRLHALRLQGL